MTLGPLLPIYAIIFIDVLGLTVILPMLPYYAEAMGATPLIATALISTYALCQLLSAPLMGRLSDRHGRRPLLLASQAGTLVGFVVLALAQSLWLVFLGRIIDGLTAGNIAVAQAALADRTPPKERPKAFSLIGMAFGLGFIVGPALGVLLAKYGPRAPLFAAAGLSALTMILTAVLLPSQAVKDAGAAAPPAQARPASQAPAPLDPPTTRALRPLYALFFLFAFAFSAFNGGLALFAERRFGSAAVPFTAADVARVFAFAGGVGLIFQLGLTARLIDRLGERRVVLLAFAAGAVGYLGLGWSPTVLAMYAATVFAASAHATLRPAITSLVSHRVGAGRQGQAMGTVHALQSGAQVVAPLAAGALIGGGALVGWAALAAAVVIVAFVAAWRWIPCVT